MVKELLQANRKSKQSLRSTRDFHKVWVDLGDAKM